jgi:hypothetical protein
VFKVVNPRPPKAHQGGPKEASGGLPSLERNLGRQPWEEFQEDQEEPVGRPGKLATENQPKF